MCTRYVGVIRIVEVQQRAIPWQRNGFHNGGAWDIGDFFGIEADKTVMQSV